MSLLPSPSKSRAVRKCEVYNSALLRMLSRQFSLQPPATTTLPFWSSVAVCRERPVLRLAVALHVPVFGSYSSAVLREEPPPTTNTFPSGSNVAVLPLPALLRLPVKLQTPVDGSYNSAVSVD